jgi:hypothetical protein
MRRLTWAHLGALPGWQKETYESNMRPLIMKPYLVKARLAYEVQASTADEALRLVSGLVHDNGAVAIEYPVREQSEPVRPKESQPADLHGLTKPVYTVSDAAALPETSRSSVYGG